MFIWLSNYESAPFFWIPKKSKILTVCVLSLTVALLLFNNVSCQKNILAIHNFFSGTLYISLFLKLIIS
jgi:hypothetical protein